MLTTNEIDTAVRAVVWPGANVNRADREAARVAYRAEVAGLERDWREWLEAEYAEGIPASLLTNIFDRAWAEGHSSGYQDVENHYEQIADFAREVLAAK